MRWTVGVSPPEELRRRSRLFQALSAVFPADFRPSGSGESAGLDALIVIGEDAPAPPARIPMLWFADPNAGEATCERTGSIQLENSKHLDSRLRGRQLAESVQAGVQRIVEGVPLARDESGVLWASAADGRDVEAAALAPPELEPGQPLRDLFRAGRFISLLPLVSLLRRVTAYEQWERPAPRATLLFDDPNLHWPSYGYIDFSRLAEHAGTHGYHASIATVPLDSWFAHGGAVRAFVDHGEHLSLALHGNDHTFCELDVAVPLETGLSLLEHAIRRITRFERRTGLSVDRVMIPPHGLCSDEMLEAMAAYGMDALCRAPVWWDRWDAAARQTARWTMADMSPSGTPILGRRLLSDVQARDEATLDLYLDRPVILYGHHHDLRDGYGVLADAAAWLNGFQGLEWASLGSLARTNTMSRREGDRLRVRAFTRCVTIRVPQGVGGVDLELPANSHSAEDAIECNGRTHELELSGAVVGAVLDTNGANELELRIRRSPAGSIPPRRTRLRTLFRRTASEVRDRLQPAADGARLSKALVWIESAIGKRR